MTPEEARKLTLEESSKLTQEQWRDLWYNWLMDMADGGMFDEEPDAPRGRYMHNDGTIKTDFQYTREAKDETSQGRDD